MNGTCRTWWAIMLYASLASGHYASQRRSGGPTPSPLTGISDIPGEARLAACPLGNLEDSVRTCVLTRRDLLEVVESRSHRS